MFNRLQTSCPMLVSGLFYVLLFCSSQAIAQTVYKEVPSEVVLQAGEGFNTVTGTSKAKCMAESELKCIKGCGAQETEFSYRKIYNKRDLNEALNLDVAASLGLGMWDASGAFEYASSDAYNSYNLYLVTSVEVINNTQTLVEKRLLPKFVNRLNDDPKAFRQQCGNGFVDSYTTGGKFYAVVEIATQSIEQRDKIAGSLNVKADTYGELSASLENIKKEQGENIDINYRLVRKGTNDDIPTMDQVFEYARTFPSKVAIGNDGEYLFAVTVRNYDNAVNWEPGDNIIPSVQDNAINSASYYYDQAITHRNDIRFILQNKEQFQDPNIEKLRKHLDIMENYNYNLLRKAEQCAKNESLCVITSAEGDKSPLFEAPPLIDLPKRIDRVESNESTYSIETLTGTRQYAPTGSRVFIILYGETASIREKLDNIHENDRRAGQLDRFIVKSDADIGPIQRVRFEIERSPKNDKDRNDVNDWFVEQVTIRDHKYHRYHSWEPKAWLGDCTGGSDCEKSMFLRLNWPSD